MKSYLVIYEKAEDGTIWARVPDLSGCYSCGNTIEEAQQNVVEAIELFLETATDEGINTAPHYIHSDFVKVA